MKSVGKAKKNRDIESLRGFTVETAVKDEFKILDTNVFGLALITVVVALSIVSDWEWLIGLLSVLLFGLVTKVARREYLPKLDQDRYRSITSGYELFPYLMRPELNILAKEMAERMPFYWRSGAVVCISSQDLSTENREATYVTRNGPHVQVLSKSLVPEHVVWQRHFRNAMSLEQ